MAGMNQHKRHPVAWCRGRAVFPTVLVWAGLVVGPLNLGAASAPIYARQGMVVSQCAIASRVGLEVLREGGNAVDAAVATAFALAVTYPAAGNVGGGGFLLYRPAQGETAAYDFRETAPAVAHERMFLKDGVYDSKRHHLSHQAVGVPGTVAGLHLAWRDHGKLPWRRLLAPGIRLAEDGFPVSYTLAGSLKNILPQMTNYPASLAQFSRRGAAFQPGDKLRQKDLANTLRRIAARGPAGFYEGETARLLTEEMRRHGGLITGEDLLSYQARRREPVRGSYGGLEVFSMPPPSSGGVALVEMLNILEGFDLRAAGMGSAANIHRVVEAMRRAFADRAKYLGDPDCNPGLPVDRLLSKDYAGELRAAFPAGRAGASSPQDVLDEKDSRETTHLSVVDASRNAVALTYTLEDSFGSRIVVPGAGFLLNNEMGDFNAGYGLTATNGLIGTLPNLAAPRKRMLSSMTPTIVTRDGELYLVLGSPGGRTIINTILLTLLNVADFEMNIQEAVDAPRFHHQWLPDQIVFERHGISPDTLGLLEREGYRLETSPYPQGFVCAIFLNSRTGWLEAGMDHRAADAGAAGW